MPPQARPNGNEALGLVAVLLFAGCGTLSQDAPLLRVRADGSFESPPTARRLLLEAPGDLRLSNLIPALEAALDAGTLEFDARPGIPSAPPIVPLRIPLDTSGIGYSEASRFRMLWRLGDSFDLAVAWARCGPEGAVIFQAPRRVYELPWFVDEPNSPPRPKVAVPSTPPAFAVLEARPEDRFRDLVLSLVALERLYPGRTLLELRSGAAPPK